MTDRRRIEYRSDLETREFETGARRMRDRFRDMGQGLQDLGVVGFGQLSQFMGYSARDLIETGARFVQGAAEAAVMGEKIAQVSSSFNTIFGPAADNLRTKLDETRRSMALSRSETESMLLPMGQMATNAGFTADAAANLSGKLLTMAGDVAAFNPLIGDSSEALGAMQAALRGEFDPLERFGSKLSAARVKAEAARLRGIDPLNAALTDQQLEIMAVVSLLEQDFAPALGTLEAAEGSAADNMNELTAAWKDGKEAGYRLANETLTPLLGDMADLIERNAEAAEKGNILGQTFSNVAGVLGTIVSPAVYAVRKGVETFGGAADDTRVKFQEFGDTSAVIAEALARRTGSAMGSAGGSVLDLAADTEEAERRVAAAVDRWAVVLDDLAGAYERAARRSRAQEFLSPGGGDDRGPEGPEFGRRVSESSASWNQINGAE